MSDLLVRLYALPPSAPWLQRAEGAAIVVRRCEAWDRFPMRRFVTEHFGDTWASEADFAFASGHPITAFTAVKDGSIAGFAAFECTRRGYFGPTGVREVLRGSGAGAALLLGCLEAMRDMGYAYAIIGGAGTGTFYEKVCGATVIEGSDPGVCADLYRERASRAQPSG